MAIPLNIFTMWHTKELPQKMKEVSESIKNDNPDFNYQLFDIDDCREFLINNFEPDIINAYDNLLPMAFKTDLWRYCILYIYGGIYYDIKFKTMNNFKFSELLSNEYFCRDMHPPDTVYNAIIVSRPNNTTMRRAIYKIVDNVKNKYFGCGSLDPTGPILLTNCLSNEEKQKICYDNAVLRLRDEVNIYFNNKIILMRYPEYREEQSKYQITDHYDKMWREGKVYK
jgi:mannosyltransferase OCH1-like enzyme